jgi:hypothetical protein
MPPGWRSGRGAARRSRRRPPARRRPGRCGPVPSRIQAAWTVLMPLATRPGHPMYCRFTPAVAVRLSPALSRRRRGSSAGPSASMSAGGGLQAVRAEPPHRAHRRARVPDRVVQQPLRLVRCPVSGEPSDRPPVPLRGRGTYADTRSRLRIQYAHTDMITRRLFSCPANTKPPARHAQQVTGRSAAAVPGRSGCGCSTWASPGRRSGCT